MMLRTLSNSRGNIWLPRYASMAQGATIPQLFTALPAGTPGLGYRLADSRFLSNDRNGSTGFGATSGSLGLVLDQARGALDALGPDALGGAGTFDSATGWSLSGAATIDDGTLRFAGGGAGTATRAVTLPAGTVLDLRFYRGPGASGAANVAILFRSGTNTIETINIGGTAPAGDRSRYVKLTSSVDSFRVTYNGSGSHEYVLDNISVREIPGTHAHALSDAARPNIEAFPGSSALGARFDGIDDALQTVAELNMSSTDEVTVIAVVRSLSDAVSIVAETSPLSSGTNGAFGIYRNSGAVYSMASRAQALQFVSTGAFAQPDNAIVIGRAKISSPVVGVIRNSAAETTVTGAQGSGNYSASHLLNIGARNAASLFFNGHLAAVCVVGLQPSSLPAGWVETMTGLLVPPGATFS